jgi:branched-chain amino acid transport system permease protein
MAVGGYFVGIWSVHHSTTPMVISLLLATVAGGLSGLILAIPSTKLRGPYLAGLTLAFATIVPDLAQVFSSWTGGFSGNLLYTPPITPQWFINFVSGPSAAFTASYQWIADLSIVVAGCAFVVMANLFHSPTGRAMRLVRDNDVAAEIVGINVARLRTLAFVIAAAFGGLGGGLMAFQTGGSITQYTFQLSISISLLTVMVLGGMGTLVGAVLAGVIYAFSSNFVSWLEGTAGISATSNLGISLEGILFAGLLIVGMLVLPFGAWGGVLRLTDWIKGLRSRPAVTPPTK